MQINGIGLKHCVAFMAAALSTLACQSGPFRPGIQWIDNIDRAAAESQHQNKPMLVKVSTDWCGYCKKMQKETFSKNQIVGHVKQCFIPVYLDGDKNKSITQQLGVRSYPTTLIISPDGKVLSHIKGFRTAAQLSVDLNRICPREPGPTTSPSAPILAKTDQTQPLPSVFGRNCPVSPVETGSFIPADPRITTTFRGYEIGFASEEFRNAFAHNPAKYWPVADGMCVVSAAHGNGNKLGGLNHGVVFRGRIWLFADKNSRSAFEADPNKYLQWLQNQSQHVASRRPATAR